jgi:3-oxoacyl-[acyl-carrier-protein] synthase-3
VTAATAAGRATAPGIVDAPRFGWRIAGLGAALPALRVTNDELADRLDTSDEWIHARTGIRARRIAGPADSTTSLATSAARSALAAACLPAAAVDLVVVATSTPDSACPSTAARVAAELGVSAGGFDVNGACTGFVYALHAAGALLGDPSIATALVVGADRYTSLLDPEDRGTAILFGDGAGAVVVARGPAGPGDAGVLGSDLGGDPTGVAVVGVPPRERYLAMDGGELFRRAVRGLVTSGAAALAHAGATGGEVDLYVPHQANRRIMVAAADRLGIAPAKLACDLTERANTSAASIPLALDAMHACGRLRPGMRVLLSGVGAGLSWSSLYLRWGR